MAGERLNESMTHLAKLAAQADIKEGGFRNGANVMAVLAWGLQVKQDHHDCGRLELLTTEDSTAVAIICPTHGRFDAPEWKSQEQ